MNEQIKIISVNISEKKGTVKKPVHIINLTKKGIPEDAHSGSWHRQISLLGQESFDKFAVLAGRKINYGEFAENITTEGILLYETLPFDKFFNDNVELEVSQIGKKCHGDSCAIYREVGNCVMPKEGIFARVIKEGILTPGDVLNYLPKTFKAKIITLSDRAFSGEYQDLSGPRITEILKNFFDDKKYLSQIDNEIIPDDAEILKKLVTETISNSYDIIITTGGTGIGPRDITIETLKPLIEKEIPGIMESIRIKYGMDKPNALLSRGIAGITNKTIIYTLPGSVKAVNEYMEEIQKTMYHLFLMMNSIDSH
jgi:molybdopterin adenylyltransferase